MIDIYDRLKELMENIKVKSEVAQSCMTFCNPMD